METQKARGPKGHRGTKDTTATKKLTPKSQKKAVQSGDPGRSFTGAIDEQKLVFKKKTLGKKCLGAASDPAANQRSWQSVFDHIIGTKRGPTQELSRLLGPELGHEYPLGMEHAQFLQEEIFGVQKKIPLSSKRRNRMPPTRLSSQLLDSTSSASGILKKLTTAAAVSPTSRKLGFDFIDLNSYGGLSPRAQ